MSGPASVVRSGASAAAEPGASSSRHAGEPLGARALIGFLVGTATGVALLSFIWKFGLEEALDPYLPGVHAEDSVAERWEFVVASTLLAATAMLLPGWIAFRLISERLQTDRLAAAVFATAPQPMFVATPGRVVRAVNPAFSELTGLAPKSIVGGDLARLESDLQDADFYERMYAQLDTAGAWSGELWNRREDGSPYAVWLSVTSVRDDASRPISLVGVLTDVTWRKQREEAAIYDATHDSLTGLPNRRLFMERLQQILAASSVSGDMLALLFVDLDGFKQVNDRLGHAAGDELLKETAARLASCARAADTLARLGGDEFVMLVRQVTSAADAEGVAQRCLERFVEPCRVLGSDVRCGASIGIALYPEHATTPGALLAGADAAMYEVKRRGRNGYGVFRGA